MVMQQWHAATTTRHSYTLTYWLGLLISRRLTRPRDIQFELPAILNNSLG